MNDLHLDDLDPHAPDPYVLAMRPEVRFGADVEPEDDLDMDSDDDPEPCGFTDPDEDPEWELSYLARLDDGNDDDDPEEDMVQRAEWDQCFAETLASERVSTSERSPWTRILPPEVIGPYTDSVLEREGLSAIVWFEFNCADPDVLAMTLHHIGYESEICFRPWGGSRLTAIHEVAHVVTGPAYDRLGLISGPTVLNHGADFVAAHLRLLAKYANARIARLYRSVYSECGVPVPPEDRRRTRSRQSGGRTSTSGDQRRRPEAVAS